MAGLRRRHANGCHSACPRWSALPRRLDQPVPDAGSAAITKYTQAVEDIVRPLTPLLVYFYQEDVDQALRAIANERGQEWVKYQVNWKLQAPYSRRLGLEGLDGLIARDYRALTDQLYAGLGLAKLAIENSRRAWRAYCQRIMQELLGDQSHEAI